jgi:hypothetical protein
MKIDCLDALLVFRHIKGDKASGILWARSFMIYALTRLRASRRL